MLCRHGGWVRAGTIDFRRLFIVAAAPLLLPRHLVQTASNSITGTSSLTASPSISASTTGTQVSSRCRHATPEFLIR
jgi:hypothetical protein